MAQAATCLRDLLFGRLLCFLVSALELSVLTDVDVEAPEEKSREQDNQGKEDAENIAHVATLGPGVQNREAKLTGISRTI